MRKGRKEKKRENKEEDKNKKKRGGALGSVDCRATGGSAGGHPRR